MTSTTVKADSWQADRLTDVAVIRAGLLDIIDCGPADAFPTSRAPTVREKDATFRQGDPGDDQGERFWYHPTPRKQGRSNEPSDPTGKAAVAREAAIQQAVTDLSAVVSALDGVCDLAPPDELSTRKVKATYTRPARTVVDADPAMCRIHVVEVCGWLETVVAEVAGQWRSGWDGDVTLRDRVSRVESLLGGLRRRVAPDRELPAQPVRRPCACGQECGRMVEIVAGERVHPTCRKRRSRERRTA